MSRKNEINRLYIEESVTDAEHPFRKGRSPSRFDDDGDEEVTGTIRDVEAEVGDHEWTPKRLERRLVEAAKVIEITVRRAGPSGARGFWPESYPLFQDEYGKFQRTYPPEKATRARLQATSAQIARADEALQWPKRYVADVRVLKVLLTWLRLKAEPRKRFDEETERWVSISWSWLCANEMRWALATADRCRDRAKAEIIQGLRRDGVTFS
ncbi:hypothetical protein [Bosea sp. (in: a-proteobacteria)]|uniref:hypothetical protein n=1 Tax=Bosea sp. (in: a-proteobacteria) TaxID=1871050 RepID=UPI001ACEB3D2|nr:hypothetical protein [Bosea sp. (in: a-proteobacteria)]MBN9441124.1 hypothetical protein [Bosea sp. (in: a-proteobacteria)]